MPFGLTTFPLSSFDSSLQTFTYDFATSSSILLSTQNLVSAVSLDKTLDSPLGLEFESPFTEYLLTPSLDDEALPALDNDYLSLFPSPALPTTSLRPNPPPRIRSTPSLLPSPPTPSVRAPRPTGFRGADTSLTPLDAPIQSRTYVLPSVTSRKRKTVPIERALAKRKRAATPAEDAEEDDEEIPADLKAAVERKRLQNTVAARRSRLRKQARLGELEEANKELVEENEGLKSRVAELEKVLKSVGLL